MRVISAPGVELVDILRLLEPELAGTQWLLAHVEAAPGPGADDIHRASDDAERLTGTTLLRLIEACTQIIDGDFDAYRGEDAAPWVRIRAIDGAACDVLSDDGAVIDRVIARFETAVERSTSGT